MIIPRSYHWVHLHWNPGSEPFFGAENIHWASVMDCHKKPRGFVNRRWNCCGSPVFYHCCCLHECCALVDLLEAYFKEFGTFFWPRNLVKLRSFWWWNILLNASPKRRVSCWKACTSTGREISSYSSFNRPRRIYYGRSEMVWLCLSQFLLISFPE